MKNIREKGDQMLNAMQMDDFIAIVEVLNSPLDKFITFDENFCGYSGYAHDLMVNWVHPLFLKAKVDAIKKDNTNWR